MLSHGAICCLKPFLVFLCVNVLFIGWVDSLVFLLIFGCLVDVFLVLVHIHLSFVVYFVFVFGFRLFMLYTVVE